METNNPTPMNDLTYVTFFGVGHPLMASIFSGSNVIPSAKKYAPSSEFFFDKICTYLA
jgi:hypothetical protein